ncbi:30S ribosomal protein S12 methylthiotransferase RimO [Caproicibacter fermentans]|uniref:Ribosomal protein uS12 methylthiotransferase RimO n=1 Tax=Caproicibacter fermentans TaxID=2576756 RepID=A0A7G8T6I5_9FIRM|nr:30S ribosomal protein S12 methylthiotransferase RimO [Caproicibacter fermentans]QNK39226.1 30S ribosomal protein S12 methylthiotransferase RimO [Caproicibacter fermentans]
MAYSVGLVNLGCPKNQVDAELMLAILLKAGYELKKDAAEADVAIVNTCGFIDAAKQESIGEILELAKKKAEGQVRAIVVTGCLAERYREQILRELPEVDGVAGIGANSNIAQVVQKALEGDKTELFPEKTKLPLCGERSLLTPRYSAYLKIAEGCDNRCSYCAIPAIRGPYRSRAMEEIEQEARSLAAGGAKELILIAQDTSRYGYDLYHKLMLPELLRRLCRIDGPEWIRVLYAYPDSITDELLQTMASEEKIVKYLDLPLQHCSGRILKAMRRVGDRASLTALMRKIRGAVPGIILRSTLIAGFPGETEEDFEELCGFVREIRFERLGCFAYSQEEGTAAAELPGQLEEEVKRRRAELVMELQMNIMQEQAEALVGKTLRVLTEGFDREAGLCYGRGTADAPDIDGRVWFSARRKPEPGRFADVKITDCIDGDPAGRAVE